MGRSLNIENIRVRSLSVDFLEVRWDIESTTEDVLDYTFQVLRSEAPMGPFDPISTEMQDRYLFIDNNIKGGNAFRQWHYKIRCRHRETDEVTDFGPASRTADPDLVATEVRKHINLLMREFVGRRCWVLPVRTFGQRCTDCWNPTLKKRIKSGCIRCYDTGFVRGYHSPIESFIQFDPTAKAEQQTNLGTLQQQNTTARLGFFPPLKPKDLVIEPENRRWRITQVSATERLRAVLHQEVQVHAVPSSDIEYRIHFDLGTQTIKTPNGEELKPIDFGELFFGGARNFTNPQTLESFESAEFGNILGLYPR